jgi:hypothetical protein
VVTARLFTTPCTIARATSETPVTSPVASVVIYKRATDGSIDDGKVECESAIRQRATDLPALRGLIGSGRRDHQARLPLSSTFVTIGSSSPATVIAGDKIPWDTGAAMRERVEGLGELENWGTREAPGNRAKVRYAFDIASVGNDKRGTGTVRALSDELIVVGLYRLTTSNGQTLKVKNLGAFWTILGS